MKQSRLFTQFPEVLNTQRILPQMQFLSFHFLIILGPLNMYNSQEDKLMLVLWLTHIHLKCLLTKSSHPYHIAKFIYIYKTCILLRNLTIIMFTFKGYLKSQLLVAFYTFCVIHFSSECGKNISGRNSCISISFML